MSDKRNALTTIQSSLPATPTPSIPTLPSNSGGITFSPTKRALRDKKFVDAHTAFLQAKVQQCDAMKSLIESRTNAALAVAKLASLPEIAQHEYDRGRTERAAEQDEWEHAVRVRTLEREREIAHQEAELYIARKRFADLVPPPLPPAPPPAEPAPPPGPVGLTPDEVIATLGALPDVPAETLPTISKLLFGMLQEKKT